MSSRNIHQEVYFSVTILAFVSASIAAVMDPTVFHTAFAARIVKFYSLTIAFLIFFYLSFVKNEDRLSDRLLERYEKTIRRMLFLTALFLIVVMDPDPFGTNLASTIIMHIVITVTILYNTAGGVLLSLSPWLQRSRLAKYDPMVRFANRAERRRIEAAN